MPSAYTQVRIAYGTVPNVNTHRGGFCPVHWKRVREPDRVARTRRYGNTYCTGYDRADACQQARADAHEAGSRYVGDWDVRITERCARGAGKGR